MNKITQTMRKDGISRIKSSIDVKHVPEVCIVGQALGTKWYQYTFIDEYSRFRYLEAFEVELQRLGIRHKPIKPYAPRHNGKGERSLQKGNEEFYASHRFYSFQDYQKQLAIRERSYNHFPMHPLNWCSPKRALSLFASV